jgi:DNA repair exonuclease SbcCD ATPase subunit
MGLRITRLILKNFSYILSGLNKYSIDLDLRNSDKVVNIIIGKMGSCKSVILGHLQPYSSYGTLDIRNQNDEIIEGEDGLKLIEYRNGPDEYSIRHVYTWQKDHHSIKSYFKKNDAELNDSGNQTSFKTIVECQFGINQNFLRLIRLGPNVANLIDLKAAERKAFVASMLEDVEVYSLLYKKINDEHRNNMAQATVLANKLNSLSANSEDDISDEYIESNKQIEKLEIRKEELSNQVYALTAKNQEILKSHTIESFKDELTQFEKEQERLLDYINTTEKELTDYNRTYSSVSEVSKILGGLEAEKKSNAETLMNLEIEYDNKDKELKKLIDIKRSASNTEHVNSLKDSCNELSKEMHEYDIQLKDFKCEYNVFTLKSLLGKINTVNILINEVSQYSNQTIAKLMNGGTAVLSEAKKSIDMLTGKKINLQRSLNNLKYVEVYKPTVPIYIPPMCPTRTCPYYTTHPITLQKEGLVQNIDDEYKKINDQVEYIDQCIYEYTEYPLILNKINTLRELWNEVVTIVEKINSLKSKSLFRVLTNMTYRIWYSHDTIIDYIDLCEKREKYYELLEKHNAMKAELYSITNYNEGDMDNSINILTENINSIYSKLSSIESRNSEIKKELTRYEEIYLKLSEAEKIEKELASDKNRLTVISEIISDKTQGLKAVYHNNSDISIISADLSAVNSGLASAKLRNDRLRTLLSDIKITKKEFGEVQKQQELLKLILEAVSSNRGIPLVFINLFLNNCKDIVNELISDVFGDAIEILDFEVTDTEFRIPYSINGMKVADIATASQGQRSIISLALSFALMRQSYSDAFYNTMLLYNILLLDEMDGPLYISDREKFIAVLFKQIRAIGAEQIFLISHNNTFEGTSVNIIMTTEEHVDKSNLITIMRV